VHRVAAVRADDTSGRSRKSDNCVDCRGALCDVTRHTVVSHWAPCSVERLLQLQMLPRSDVRGIEQRSGVCRAYEREMDNEHVNQSASWSVGRMVDSH